MLKIMRLNIINAVLIEEKSYLIFGSIYWNLLDTIEACRILEGSIHISPYNINPT